MQPVIDVVFLSASPAPAAELDLAQLEQALADQGVHFDQITVITAEDPGQARVRLAAALRGPEAALAGVVGPTAPIPAVALLDADVIVNAPPLGAVLDDPRVQTGALAVLESGRQVQLGILKVGGSDRAAAADLARTLPGEPGDLIFELTAALTDSGIPVRPVPIGGYAWARVTATAGDDDGREAARHVVGSVNERNVRLREAARGGDGFYSTFVLRRVSWRFTEIAERSGLTPNQVTLISFGLGLLAAAFLGIGSRPCSVLGALLLQFCLVVDCVDGELARYRRRFSRFGAWLDATTDRVKEFATIAGLAVGAARHGVDLWWLVAAAIAVQTFRNLLDLGWAMQRSAAAPGRPVDLVRWAPEPFGIRPAGAPPAGPGAKSWIRRIGHFPIGERFLLISLGAAFASPRATLVALLVLGLLSGVYMLAAFGFRGSSSNASGHRIAALADTGPYLGAAILRVGGGRASRVMAVLPALTAVVELGLIWWLADSVAGARGSAVVVLVAVTAIAHYQQAYGVREETDGAQTLVLGTDLRLLVLLLVAVFPAVLLRGDDGNTWATIAVWGLAVLVAISSTLRSLRVWTDPSGHSRHAGRTRTATEDTQLPVLREAIGGVR